MLTEDLQKQLLRWKTFTINKNTFINSQPFTMTKHCDKNKRTIRILCTKTSFELHLAALASRQ